LGRKELRPNEGVAERAVRESREIYCEKEDNLGGKKGTTPGEKKQSAEKRKKKERNPEERTLSSEKRSQGSSLDAGSLGGRMEN